MESNYRYQMTKRAADDLEDIVRYMAVDLRNPSAASSFLDAFQAAVHEVLLFPESGSMVENEYLPDKKVRKTHINHYTIYYFPDSEAEMIFVLRIIYSRRNTTEIVKSLGL